MQKTFVITLVKEASLKNLYERISGRENAIPRSPLGQEAGHSSELTKSSNDLMVRLA